MTIVYRKEKNMTVRIAINGLGRIGRCVLRAITEYNRDDIEVVAINGPAAIEQHMHLLKYDSIHGTFHNIKQIGNDAIDMGRGPMKLFHERDPANLPWGELGVDIVMECTGVFNNKQQASKHLDAGAKKVIISAPAKGDVDATITRADNLIADVEAKVADAGSEVSAEAHARAEVKLAEAVSAQAEAKASFRAEAYQAAYTSVQAAIRIANEVSTMIERNLNHLLHGNHETNENQHTEPA
jgi:hypothetical protein